MKGSPIGRLSIHSPGTPWMLVQTETLLVSPYSLNHLTDLASHLAKRFYLYASFKILADNILKFSRKKKT